MDYLILVAGGQGLRMGSDVPKQFMLLGGRPIIMRTIDRFVEALPEIRIVVVLHPDYVEMWHRLCEEHHFATPCHIALGGTERFHSVKNGLDIVIENREQRTENREESMVNGQWSMVNDIVAVHDAVRPLVGVEVIRRAFTETRRSGAVVPALASMESVRLMDGSGRSMAVNRNNVMLVQTPQVFSLSLLRQAYAQPYRESFTDDASVVEALGHPIQIIPGNRENIKITTPLDMHIAAQLL